MNGQHDFKPGQVVISARLAAWVVVGAVVAGALLGRVAFGGGGDATAQQPDATATRAAELDELDHLRTRVAAPIVCTPAPTAAATATPAPSPTPTQVPAVSLGQTVAYAGDWTVTVTGFSIAPRVEEQAKGKFVQANVVILNEEAEERSFRFRDWRLIDAQGRAFKVSYGASNELSPTDLNLRLDPSFPNDFVVVFDVAADAGSTYVIESTSDPTFRVAVEIQQFG